MAWTCSPSASTACSEEAYKPRMHFFEGDITINKEWVEYHVKKCDVILPLVAIATPSTYVKEPLRVFELDFEANLPIVRSAAKYRKHLVFPSTSEVYGMSRDAEFDPENSDLVYGPINKPRWIYACSKQLMDRVIWGYGMEGLNFTLFRPFNWIGAGLDSIHTPKEGSSRVLTQFLGHIVRGENIQLVDGGAQKRSFTYVDDGIDALMRIIDNKDGKATGKIYNIGNPVNNYSIRELAHMMLELAAEYPEYATRQAGQDRRNQLGRLLRHRLPGRAEPRAEDREHDHGTGLEAAVHHARRAGRDFRFVQERLAGRTGAEQLSSDGVRSKNRPRPVFLRRQIGGEEFGRHALRLAAAQFDADQVPVAPHDGGAVAVAQQLEAAPHAQLAVAGLQPGAQGQALRLRRWAAGSRRRRCGSPWRGRAGGSRRSTGPAGGNGPRPPVRTIARRRHCWCGSSHRYRLAGA